MRRFRPHGKPALLLFACVILLWTRPGRAADYLTDAERLLRQGDLRDAQIQLRNAVKSDPQSAEPHFRLAGLTLELGDPLAAEREAKAARERGYEPGAVLPILARAYLAQGKYRQVLQEFAPGNQDPGLDADVLVFRGYAEAALGRPEDARRDLALAAERAPQQAAPHLAAARLAASRNELDHGLTELERALELDPDSAEVLAQKAQILRAKGEMDAALRSAEGAIARKPDLLAARLERASILIAVGRPEAAGKDVGFVLAAVPGSVQALHLKALLEATAKDYPAADATLTRIAPAMAELPLAYFLQAIVKLNLRQLEQAEEAAERYAARTPDDLHGAKLLASIRMRKLEPERAIAALDPAVQSGRADAQAFDLLAEAQTAAGHPDAALHSLEQASALTPADVAMRNRLGGARLGMGDVDAAVRDFERSLALVPAQPAVGASLFFAELATGDLRRAASSIETIRAALGNTAVVRNLDGLLQIAQLDPDSAQATFSAILKDHPDFTPARVNLARVAAMQGRSEEAGALLSGVLAQQPASEPALSLYAEQRMREGRNADAIAAVTRALKTAPGDARLTLTLADLWARSGDAKRGIELLRQGGAEHGPAAIPLIAARAELEAGLGQGTQARGSYRELLSLDPGTLEARLRLIGLLAAQKDYEAARNLIQEGLRLSPQNYQLLLAYVEIDLRASGIEAAVATAERLQKQNQDLAAARALKGDAFIEAGRTRNAAQAYAAEMEAAPSQMLVLRLGQTLVRQGEPDQAAAAFRDWLAEHPEDAGVAELLASLDIAASRWDEAETLLKQILNKQPRAAVALNNLAWLYQRKGDLRAEALARRAYLLLPSAQTADTLGWILTRQGSPKLGLMLLRLASARATPEPSVSYHLAVAFEKTGQRVEATKLLTKLVNDGAEFGERADARRLLGELSKS